MHDQLTTPDSRSLLQAMLADGRPLLLLTGLALIASGGFAIFQSATGHFLPHDVDYLGMTARDLCHVNQCRVVHFMFHDRVSFGGALIAIGAIYLWLAEFPLKHREAWAWWAYLISGTIGFLTFLSYLGYGYLDTWHGVATLMLMPIFVLGLVYARKHTRGPMSSIKVPGATPPWKTRAGIGRGLMLFTGAMLVAGGGVILTVGMTVVFVPQDIEYMGLSAQQLHAINPRLIPLIAHDRAGFGGGLLSIGLLVTVCVWCAKPSKSLWQILAFAGTVGFGCAIGIHPLVGYNSATHLAPAVIVAILFFVGLAFCWKPMMRAPLAPSPSGRGLG